jgi:hypothetical protein
MANTQGPRRARLSQRSPREFDPTPSRCQNATPPELRFRDPGHAGEKTSHRRYAQAPGGHAQRRPPAAAIRAAPNTWTRRVRLAVDDSISQRPMHPAVRPWVHHPPRVRHERDPCLLAGKHPGDLRAPKGKADGPADRVRPEGEQRSADHAADHRAPRGTAAECGTLGARRAHCEAHPRVQRVRARSGAAGLGGCHCTLSGVSCTSAPSCAVRAPRSHTRTAIPERVHAAVTGGSGGRHAVVVTARTRPNRVRTQGAGRRGTCTGVIGGWWAG